MSDFKSIHRRRFEFVAMGAAHELFRYLEALTDEQLGAAQAAAYDLTASNCCWQVFKMKGLILEVIGDVLMVRAPAPAPKGGSDGS